MQPTVKDIDAYIKLQPESVRGILTELRLIIKKAVPEAEELISYRMPAFRFHGMLIWFATFNKHYSIFVPRSVLNDFREDLKSFELSESKAAIKIPLDKPVPVQLLTRIVKSGARLNLEKAQLKVKGNK